MIKLKKILNIDIVNNISRMDKFQKVLFYLLIVGITKGAMKSNIYNVDEYNYQ